MIICKHLPGERAAMQPGLIILLGVLFVALLLVIVVLIPPAGADQRLNAFIPPGAAEESRARGAMLAAVTLTTTQSVNGVLEFYAGRLKLGRGITTSGGMSVWGSVGLFGGGMQTRAFLPFADKGGEGAAIASVRAQDVLIVAVSRAANEPLSHITLILQRSDEKRRAWFGTNAALRWAPPQGITGSSGTGSGTSLALFKSGAPFEDIAHYYRTNLALASAGAPPNVAWLRAGETGLLCRQPREQGESVAMKNDVENQHVFVYCFKSLTETQSHVAAISVAK